MKFPIILITAAVVALGGFIFHDKILPARAASRIAAVQKKQPVRSAREQYAAMHDGTWSWIYGTISAITRDGQIVILQDGSPVHITGDRGLTTGTLLKGYFISDGIYEQAASGGNKDRLKNYVPLAEADAAFVRRSDAYYQLHMDLMTGRADAGTDQKIKELIAMHEQLKSEGVPLKDIDLSRLQRRSP